MTTADLYAAADRSFTAVLDAAPPDGWANPSPCEGWTARDVVRHLVTTQRQLLSERGATLPPEPDVDADPARAWREHAAAVRDVLADDAFVSTGYEGYFGPTTVGATLEQFYVWDMVVHRWDVARAVGVDAGLTEEELDRVERGADSFGDALYWDDVCRPGVEAAPGADREARVLARLGRAA